MTAKPVRIDVAFGLLAFLTIAFQKLALPNGQMIGVPTFVMWGVLLYLLIRGAAVIDPLRAVCFGGMLCAIIVSLLIERKLEKGPNPLILFLICYSALIVRVDVDRETLLKCLNWYQRAITIVAVIVILQQIIQYTIGSQFWPNYEKMVPKSLLIPGYMYIRPYDWNSRFLTPNGFFFLEPSGLSEYLALGVVTEIVWFKRLGRLAIIALGVVSAMAGTGLTILTLLSPFLIRTLDQRLRNYLIGVGVPLVLLGVLFGAFSHIAGRSAELSQGNSSGHGRLVAPFEDTIALATDPAYLISGNSPGTSMKAGDVGRSDDAEVQWPSDKLIYEYGLLTSVLFHVFMFVAAFRYSPSPVLAAAIFIPQMCFGGGFVTASGIVALVMFSSLLRLKEDAVAHAQLGRRSRQLVEVSA